MKIIIWNTYVTKGNVCGNIAGISNSTYNFSYQLQITSIIFSSFRIRVETQQLWEVKVEILSLIQQCIISSSRSIAWNIEPRMVSIFLASQKPHHKTSKILFFQAQCMLSRWILIWWGLIPYSKSWWPSKGNCLPVKILRAHWHGRTWSTKFASSVAVHCENKISWSH